MTRLTPTQATLAIEEVARLPQPGMAIPAAFEFVPGQDWITYLFSPSSSLERKLYKFNPADGKISLMASPTEGGASEENLQPAEKLRRERQRQLETGITSYSWAAKRSQECRMLAPLADGLYIQDGIHGELTKVLDIQGEPALDPQLSPDGEYLAFVRNDELWVLDIAARQARQVTSGAKQAGVTHALAEYVAQEEMDRQQGYWWSPDNRRIAFTEIDEQHIPLYTIVHPDRDDPGPSALEVHRYPFAGQPNAHIKLGVTSIEGSQPLWLDLGEEKDIYLARVNWLANGQLAVQLLNRPQTQLDLIFFDASSGKGRLILRETSKMWINLHDLFRPLKDGRFIWASESSGFRHLYLYNQAGTLIHPITQGEWMVDSLAAVDEAAGLVYFTASAESPLECHLYVIALDGSGLRRITQQAGLHTVVVDVLGGRFIDTHDALDQPPQVSLRSLADGRLLQTIYQPADPRLEALRLEPPRLVTLSSRDGERLFGAVYQPDPATFGSGPHPVIVAVYGGPHAQMVVNGWRMTVAMRAQYLRSQGYLVFMLDNRGSARRGLVFEGQIRHNMGDLEVRDQVDGVNWLAAQGLADPKRVGIYGWSYGGYMALMCLARAPQTFGAAVSGAPVTHWDGYDTNYTERYMGTPASNPAGYQISSVLQHVEHMRGRLLLVHGLIDENVHFRHTARLINALIRNRKPYELLLFPDERHSPRRLEDRVYMEERISEFFKEALQ
jgi:dipeptidyl-peptidase-4